MTNNHQPFPNRKSYFTGRPLNTGNELEAFCEQEAKYFDLVWYARKAPKNDKEYWDKTPADIKKGAFKAIDRVEKKYPKEVERLSKEIQIGEVVFSNPDWEHGFNSGCLAAFRFVLTALNQTTETCEETGEELCYGGVENAKETFPDLDT